jgi:hypothetical protein
MLALNRSLLNREYTLINVLKSLASIIFMCGLHAIFLSKITPRYVTLLTNGMFRPDQCKKKFNWPTSMREVDCPSFVFIDFNVPTFTPGRHLVQAALKFSENVALLAFCRIKTGVFSEERLTPIVWGCHLYTSYIVLETERNLVTPLLSFLMA